MKLWELSPAEGGYKFGWDEAHGYVIRAATEEEARIIASRGGVDGRREDKHWLDHDQTFCQELTVDGDAEVVLEDFRAG